MSSVVGGDLPSGLQTGSIKPMGEYSLLDTYRRMLTIRLVEERLEALFSEGSIFGTCHLCIGQEAVAVGVCEALQPDDQMVSCHRGHGHLLAKGGQPARLFGELMGKQTGYCRGRGGSQHISVPGIGFLGTNGITGGGIPLATGAAFSAQHQKANHIVVCCFGDGATSQGTFHESLNMASLWKLPILYVCENNGYAMSTPVSRTVAGGDILARAEAYAMRATRVDGMDALAVRQAAAEAAEYVRAGKGPAFLEAITYRYCGHSKSDRLVYRSREEEAEWKKRDPISQMRGLLAEEGLETEAEQVEVEVRAWVEQAEREARDAADADPVDVLDKVYAVAESVPRSESDMSQSKRRNPETPIYFTDALREALDEAMARDSNVILLGEDIGAYGGAFGVTRGLIEQYGPERVRETPISENSFVGLAVGAAMTGLCPVVEIMFMDFILLAADQIINHAAKLHYIYDGQVTVPMVIRTPVGAGRGYGASHSQNLEAVFMSIPGLKIVAPSNPFDAKGLLAAAIRDPNPVLFIESKALYGKRGKVLAQHIEVPLGQAQVVREGSDLSLIAYGGGVEIAKIASRELADGGIEADIIDLRTLKPMDEESVFSSVRKTGRCIVIEEGHLTGGIGAEVSARITENCFSDLRAPVQRVALADTPIPSAASLEGAILPTPERIYEAVEKIFG